ncbi:WDR45B_2 [Blepharisma stoltei]|uniref:WD repeat domain phosphoinositide-interacting protein 4 n=1 Tax=Blepharisma stoltei TaxID=1481888 RepID=A0AAU9JY25_9CILI|nr:unnamed protein product [Blepharisma stoltei]
MTAPQPSTNRSRLAEELLSIRFNQDFSCFCVGTDTSFRIFKTSPLKYCFRRDFSGGIGMVELLNRSNIVALVGGGKSPRYPPNKVIIWDDHLMRPTGELTFRTDVKNVKLRKDRIIAVLANKIYVYNLTDLKIRDTIPTAPNPKGICAISSVDDRIILACPDKAKGSVCVQFYSEEKTLLIRAHRASIMCLEFNSEATMLATASDRGTVIRIFKPDDGSLLQELRRGIDRAEIYCLNFHPSSEWLACSSDKGTIHIFSTDTTKRLNPRSTFSFLKYVLKGYFESERSFAVFRVRDAKTICAFGAVKNTLVVLNADGCYYLASFNPDEGGECQLINSEQVIDLA